MRSLVLLVIAGAAALVPAAGMSAGASANGRCRVVVKKVHGKKRRVRVCKRVPRPAPLPQAGTVAAKIPLPTDVVSVAAGETSVWVTTEDRKLLRIDPATNTVVATIALPDSEWPENVAYGDDAAWVSVASPDTLNMPELDSVLRIDPARNAVVARIGVGHSPEGIAFTPDGVWVADHRSETAATGPTGTFSVSRVDPKANKEIARIHVESRQTSDPHGQFCCGPQGIAAAAGAVWAADPTDTPGRGFVVRLDPQTNAVVATIPLGVAEACGEADGDDAGVWFAAGCDQPYVTRIDPHTNRVVARVDVGGTAFSLALGFGSIWASGDGLTRVDPTKNAVVARTPVPDNGPLAVGAGSIWIGSGNTLLRIDPA